MFGLILLAAALSIDTLGIGITYQLRKIKIPWKAKMIIGLVSWGMTTLALGAGKWVAKLISPEIISYIGAGVIIVMGIRVLIVNFKEEKAVSYDRDQSESIDCREALVLGFALSADSISAGFAVSLLGGSTYLFPIVVAAMAILFLWFGERIRLSQKKSTAVAGVMLVIIGLFRLLA